jgi:hypothetical protein
MMFSLFCEAEFGVEVKWLPFFLMKLLSTALWDLFELQELYTQKVCTFSVSIVQMRQF